MLTVDVVTPERERYSGKAEYVQAPGSEGILGILPRHANLLSTLESGELLVRDSHRAHFFAIGNGFVHIQDNHVLVLASQAFKPDEIDLPQAQAEQRHLLEELAATQATETRRRLESRLRLTNARIAIARREQPRE